MNDGYPYELDNAVTEYLWRGDYLGAWGTLHELVDEILDRPVPVAVARPKLQTRLLSLLKHLVDTNACLTIDPEIARHAIGDSLGRARGLKPILHEFRALVCEILVPSRFIDYLGRERQRLAVYLEMVAKWRLKDRSGAPGTVDDVFADILAEAHEAGSWELPGGPEWESDLTRRVRNKADNRDDRRDRRLRLIRRTDDPEAVVPPSGDRGVDSPAAMRFTQEVSLYVSERFADLSTDEWTVYERDLQGYTDEEISEDVGIPLRTVQRMLQAIRRRFRNEEP